MFLWHGSVRDQVVRRSVFPLRTSCIIEVQQWIVTGLCCMHSHMVRAFCVCNLAAGSSFRRCLCASLLCKSFLRWHIGCMYVVCEPAVTGPLLPMYRALSTWIKYVGLRVLCISRVDWLHVSALQMRLSVYWGRARARLEFTKRLLDSYSGACILALYFLCTCEDSEEQRGTMLFLRPRTSILLLLLYLVVLSLLAATC